MRATICCTVLKSAVLPGKISQVSGIPQRETISAMQTCLQSLRCRISTPV
jgi:hypothetical protein